MTMTVADQFADALAVAGVKRIYGIVGGSLNDLPFRDRAGSSGSMSGTSVNRRPKMPPHFKTAPFRMPNSDLTSRRR
jgi:hypothetical protein